MVHGGSSAAKDLPTQGGTLESQTGGETGEVCTERQHWGCREVLLGAETVSAHGRESETMLIRSPHHLSYFNFHPPFQSWNIGLN